MLSKAGTSDVIILGAGGHARVLVDALRRNNINVRGFVTIGLETGKDSMSDLSRVGNEEQLLAMDRHNIRLVNGVGSVGQQDARRGLFEKFKSAGFDFASVIHPGTIIAADVVLEEGVQI